MASGKNTSKKTNKPDGKKILEVANLAVSTAIAKGWNAEIDNIDDDGGQFASIGVERNFGWDRTVTGSLEFSFLAGSLKLKTENTSFHSNGLGDLQDSVWSAIGELPWLTDSRKEGSEISDHVTLLSRLLRRFHRSARQLKHRYADREPIRIRDEYDVQDYLHALLRSLFDDVRAEEYTPSYAGGASRIDFLLKSEGIAIEVKLASANLRDKKIGDQLLIDIQRYQVHPNTKVLFCFVYDPEGEIRNPAGLEADLSKTHDDLVVKMIVVSPS